MSRKINSKRLSIDEEFVKYEILTASNDLSADVDEVTVAFFGIDSFLNTDIWINSLDQLMRVVNENTTTFDAIFVCEEISDALHVSRYEREEIRTMLKAFKRYIKSSFINRSNYNVSLKCYKDTNQVNHTTEYSFNLVYKYR